MDNVLHGCIGMVVLLCILMFKLYCYLTVVFEFCVTLAVTCSHNLGHNPK